MPLKPRSKRLVIPRLDKKGTVHAGSLKLDLRALSVHQCEKIFGWPEVLIANDEFGVAEWWWKDGAVFGVRFTFPTRMVLNVKFSFREPLPARRTIVRALFADGKYVVVSHGSGMFLENKKHDVLLTLDDTRQCVRSVGFFAPHAAHAHDVCDCPHHKTIRTAHS